MPLLHYQPEVLQSRAPGDLFNIFLLTLSSPASQLGSLPSTCFGPCHSLFLEYASLYLHIAHSSSFRSLLISVCPTLFKVALSIPLCSWVWSFPLPCCSLTLYWSTLEYHSYSILECKQHEDKNLGEFPLAPQLLKQCLACRSGSITIDKGTHPQPLFSFPHFMPILMRLLCVFTNKIVKYLVLYSFHLCGNF